MKKISIVIASAVLALPLAFSAPLAANAAPKTYSYTVSKAITYKKAKVYHTKDATPYVFKGAFMADRPTVSFQAKAKLKAGTTYYVTKALKVQNKAKKNGTFLYVKGNGWIASSKLTAGKFMQAD
ncbi:hypothetical protein PL11_001140 [Lentilactobacillus curieae]|uniref:Surface layer protein A domain-containing protein n=1 Tax=Lentilactobacillus curieae TaxID=1138822 RepID=A0A1S6QG75_9LACO|nr:hypothetical protein [Lentilactobacillus curieae]AQW20613.1 hypothetical protein PL11_001140 [Lentilactobacillus curieae]